MTPLSEFLTKVRSAMLRVRGGRRSIDKVLFDSDTYERLRQRAVDMNSFYGSLVVPAKHFNVLGIVAEERSQLPIGYFVIRFHDGSLQIHTETGSIDIPAFDQLIVGNSDMLACGIVRALKGLALT